MDFGGGAEGRGTRRKRRCRILRRKIETTRSLRVIEEAHLGIDMVSGGQYLLKSKIHGADVERCASKYMWRSRALQLTTTKVAEVAGDNDGCSDELCYLLQAGELHGTCNANTQYVRGVASSLLYVKGNLYDSSVQNHPIIIAPCRKHARRQQP